jgi:hypothetical protein
LKGNVPVFCKVIAGSCPVPLAVNPVTAGGMVTDGLVCHVIDPVETELVNEVTEVELPLQMVCDGDNVSVGVG